MIVLLHRNIFILCFILWRVSPHNHTCAESHSNDTTTEEVNVDHGNDTDESDDIRKVHIELIKDKDLVSHDYSEESDDTEEAFIDIEEEDVLCKDYKDVPKKKKFPKAIIIGVRKGGTRALLEFLNMNSRVRRAKPELHFFDNKFDLGLDWYIEKMPSVSKKQIAMEKTPGYFHTPGVPKRIFETAPSTKLILIVRNPVDRMISDYNQFRNKMLDQGFDYPSLEHFLFTKAGNINIGYQPLQRSIYHYHLTRWMMYFPLSQIHIVDGDRFIKEPWEELGLLENFLNIRNEITKDNFFFNATKGFHCGQEQLNMPGSDWSCTRKKCLNRSKGRPKPKVAQETYQKLTKFYSSHNKLFYNLVKKNDFGWPETWKEED